MPRISIIAALNEKRVIGKDDKLPWSLPADLGHFRELTTGKPVIVGRRTYESMGKPLKERRNLILTKQPDYRVQGCVTVHSISEAMEKVGDQPEVMVIGGASVYCQFLPLADRLYLTLVHNTLEGDALFPEVSKEEWMEIERIHCPADARNPWPITFLTLDRVGSRPAENTS